MIRLLFWIALLYLAIRLWRRLNTPGEPQQPPERPAESMVRCAHCDLHVPRPEALQSTGNWYCCQHHLELGPRQLDQ